MYHLSKDELELVRKHRENKEKRHQAELFQAKAIATAFAFGQWSAHTNEGLTFSTFVNSFGYQERDSKEIYEAVKRINEAAKMQ